MEQDLVQRIALLVVYSLILVPAVRWGIRNAKKEVRNGIPPLTWRSAFTRGLVFALMCGSSAGIFAALFGRKYGHPIGKALWAPIYVGILTFILGGIGFPLVQLLSERTGTIRIHYSPEKASERHGTIRYRAGEVTRVRHFINAGFAFLAAFVAGLAITFLRNGELNWKRSFLVGLSIFITYFIVLATLRPEKSRSERKGEV